MLIQEGPGDLTSQARVTFGNQVSFGDFGTKSVAVKLALLQTTHNEVAIRIFSNTKTGSEDCFEIN